MNSQRCFGGYFIIVPTLFVDDKMNSLTDPVITKIPVSTLAAQIILALLQGDKRNRKVLR